MKNKEIVIALICLGVAVGLTAVFVGGIFLSGNNMATVNCYVTENGHIYMAYDGRLVGLHGTGDIDISTGDRAFVIFGSSFAESFPESTRAIYIVKTSHGEPEDIVLDGSYKLQLEEFGFVFE